jgi:hypothetical protein
VDPEYSNCASASSPAMLALVSAASVPKVALEMPSVGLKFAKPTPELKYILRAIGY